jgi:hypothetical protein
VVPRTSLDGCGKYRLFPTTGIPSPDLPARSESLYRLRYPCPRDHDLRTCKGVYCVGRWVSSGTAAVRMYRSVSHWFGRRFLYGNKEIGDGKHTDTDCLANDVNRFWTNIKITDSRL